MNAPLLAGVPRLTVDDAAALARQFWGLDAQVRALASERDQNFMLTAAEGRRYVLKVANSSVDRALLDAEHLVMWRASATGVCPDVVADADGRVVVQHGEHYIRLITALDGQTLGSTPFVSGALRRDIGRAVGALDRALEGLDHPSFHRNFHWDLAQALDVVEAHASLIADDALRAQVLQCAAYHRTHVAPQLADFRRSVIHADVNDYNVLVDPARQTLTGIVDFGDAMYTHTVNDVAIAMAYIALGADDPLAAAADVAAGYHAVMPLTTDEIAALFSLMRMRLAVSACLAARQQAERPDLAYLGISQGPISRTLPLLTAIHPRFAHYTLRAACGLPAVPHAPRVERWLSTHAPTFAPLVGHDLRSARVAPISLGVGSVLLSSNPAENTAAAVDARVSRVISEQQAVLGAGGYDEARVMYEFASESGAADSITTERRTIHMGLDLSMPAGTPLFAPFPGEVHSFEFADQHHDYGPLIVLRHHLADDGAGAAEFFSLYGHLSVDSLDGLYVGQPIAQGAEFARIGSAPTNGDWWAHVHVQLVTDMLDVRCNIDGAVRPSQRDVWRSLCPDPNLMLGIPADRLPVHRSASDVASRRAAHLGRNLSVSYGSSPLHIERGWKQYLYDDTGRRYLDAYNNVAHVGHAHPRVVRAVSEQLAVLNTNTRYLQDQLIEYANDLTALFPQSLSVCYFTASGSEANELALRLARAYTGQRDLIVMDSAYHGHTTTLIDISPYKHAGPGGQGAPDWVHPSPIPDVYRCRDVVGAPGAWFAAQVGAAIARIDAMGRGLCGYIAETCPSVGGQIMLPEGFLADVYARVRAAGGICIADEVQTGFGRLGSHFWAFEQHDVVPDIVVLGKPIANGYPMGAVVTTRAIADAFDNGMEFFSTFGGSTAACVAARATLQVTREEQLQANAQRVGERLLEGLRPLVRSCELVGDVRGSGLFLGVELVRDRETRAPDADAATWVVNRMRALGVLAGTDGPFHNVIKLRGPMPTTLLNADQIVSVLHRALREYINSA
ncbi:MAG: aminotransferase class III-fold pyridoxal phosphate-dependent enzyme [Gemmatimonadaceae bacterium]|jgi:4-aminobutyrate aminotransferase-like enzyme/Ser/Thr protein kinase RdoA (MazF antagonist)|nr:aminotransferase class III-fold pyridoxal phosphate-dependent enzyme [Gemmatimonadaceae bacterium]MCC6431786.1 aminotransferase class III-fold pyridoxal phosphate-dependent enzyme [Gemmatimonadaceae bacterium]